LASPKCFPAVAGPRGAQHHERFAFRASFGAVPKHFVHFRPAIVRQFVNEAGQIILPDDLDVVRFSKSLGVSGGLLERDNNSLIHTFETQSAIEFADEGSGSV